MMECTDEEAKIVFRRFYDKFLKIIPIQDLVSDFYRRSLLSQHHKNQINDLRKQSEKRKYFLDDVICPSIQVGDVTQFTEMLVVMGQSDTVAVKFVADEVKDFFHPRESITHSPDGKKELSLIMPLQPIFLLGQ